MARTRDRKGLAGEIDIWRSVWPGLLHPGEPPGIGNSLRANFVYSLAGNAVFAACQWGILTVLVKWGASEVVGRFVFASALVTPFFSFFNLQLRQVQASDASGRFSFLNYLRSRFMTTAFSLALILVLVLARSFPGRGAIILLFGLTKASESVSDIYYGLFQRHMRVDKIGISLAARGLTSLVALALAFYLTHSLIWGLAAILVSWVASLFICDVRNGRAISGQVGWRDSGRLSIFGERASPERSIIRLGLPLGLVMIMIALETSIPRIVMDFQRGESELGIFAALLYPAVLGAIVITAVSDASLPQLAKDYASGSREHFGHVVRHAVLVALGLGLAGLVLTRVLGQWLLRVLYTPEYAKHAGTFVWVMAASGITYAATVLGAAATAMQRFKIQTVIHGLNVMFLVASSLVLIGAFGMRGGAYAMLASASFLAVSYGLVVWSGSRAGKGDTAGTAISSGGRPSVGSAGPSYAKTPR